MGLAANPLGALYHLARLYGEGGLVVDDRPYLRTLIQPDGDVVARVARSFYALDPARRQMVLQRHLARIRSAERAANSLRRALQLLPRYAWVPVSVTFVGGGTVFSVEWLMGLLAAAGGLGLGFRFVRPLAVRGGLGLIRWRLRRTVGSRFRG